MRAEGAIKPAQAGLTGATLFWKVTARRCSNKLCRHYQTPDEPLARFLGRSAFPRTNSALGHGGVSRDESRL